MKYLFITIFFLWAVSADLVLAEEAPSPEARKFFPLSDLKPNLRGTVPARVPTVYYPVKTSQSQLPSKSATQSEASAKDMSQEQAQQLLSIFYLRD